MQILGSPGRVDAVQVQEAGSLHVTVTGKLSPFLLMWYRVTH
jgi:hypothetical protein